MQATPTRRLALVPHDFGMPAAATTLAERGHDETLFDAAGEIGGQFNLARRVPGMPQSGTNSALNLTSSSGSSSVTSCPIFWSASRHAANRL